MKNLSKSFLYLGLFVESIFLCSCYVKELNQSLEDAFWWRTYHTIINKPSSEWNARDCLTVMMENMASNILNSRTNIKAFALAYTPPVIMAMSKYRWLQIPVDGKEAQDNYVCLLKYGFGMYYDETNDKIMDSRGNYFKDKTQIDSLMFCLTLENNAWSSGASSSGLSQMILGKLNAPELMNSYCPDITDLNRRIYLVNDQNTFIRPKTVWGRKKNMLTLPETLLLMFYVREGNHSFLEKGENIYLVIKGFEQDIKLQFPLKNLEDKIKQR